MKIQITLSKTGPAIWMLGSPRPAPKVCLNFGDMGPVDIETSDLSEAEKKQLLIGLNKEAIVCDISYEELYQDLFPVVQEVVQANTVLVDPPRVAQETTVQIQGLRKSLEDRDRQLECECEDLISKGVRAIRNVVTNPQHSHNIKLFRTLLKLEQKKPLKKQRQSVVSLLEDKLRKYQVMVITDIEKSAAQSLPVASPTPYDRIKYEVEESEQELVTFSVGS